MRLRVVPRVSTCTEARVCCPCKVHRCVIYSDRLMMVGCHGAEADVDVLTLILTRMLMLMPSRDAWHYRHLLDSHVLSTVGRRPCRQTHGYRLETPMLSWNHPLPSPGTQQCVSAFHYTEASRSGYSTRRDWGAARLAGKFAFHRHRGTCTCT